MIQVKNLTFSYNGQEEAIKDVSFSIKKGTFNVILGHNGSGKSTLAKILVGLVAPKQGEVLINDMKLVEENVYELRKKIGIVFQNPDNQFVGVTVRHDIAFGLENLRLSTLDMEERVIACAKRVGMEAFLKKEPHQLSGGQKQRVAIASAIAMSQEILILDEATSMLDPQGVKDIMALIKDLNKKDNKTIIMITHDLRLAKDADYIIALKDGQILTEGQPKDVLMKVDLLAQTQLLLPLELSLYHEISNHQTIDDKIKEALWAFNFKK